jgi:SAM-dependent methyltransferase
MLQSVLDYLKFAVKTLELDSPIYEFGSRQADDERDANLRRFFPDTEYVGCDMQPGKGVDRVLNLHAIDLPDSSVPSVLCLDTLEHVEYPRRAVREMSRILKPNGILLISSVMNFPIHSHPNDYWRFTPEGFRSLLSPFPTHHVGFCGPDDFPSTIFGVGWKGKTAIPEGFLKAYSAWYREMRINLKILQSMTEAEQIELMKGHEASG